MGQNRKAYEHIQIDDPSWVLKWNFIAPIINLVISSCWHSSSEKRGFLLKFLTYVSKCFKIPHIFGIRKHIYNFIQSACFIRTFICKYLGKKSGKNLSTTITKWFTLKILNEFLQITMNSRYFQEMALPLNTYEFLIFLKCFFPKTFSFKN